MNTTLLHRATRTPNTEEGKAIETKNVRRRSLNIKWLFYEVYHRRVKKTK